MSRLIFHIDVNSAFLSWEATRRVSLGEDDIRLVPSAIGGDREKRTGVRLGQALSGYLSHQSAVLCGGKAMVHL